MADLRDTIIDRLIQVYDAYQKQTPLVSNQGQAMDGFTALDSFISIAAAAKELVQSYNAHSDNIRLSSSGLEPTDG